MSVICSTQQPTLINRGLQYGDGLFETMRLVNGQIPLWDLHWQRLVVSSEKLHLQVPDEERILEAINNQTLKNGLIKLILVRQSQGRGYGALHNQSVWILELIKWTDQKINEPLTVGIAEFTLGVQPALAGIKHLNRLEQVLLGRELLSSGLDELLATNVYGYLIEGVNHNVFWLKKGALLTPELSESGVNGVGLSWLRKYYKIREVKVKSDVLLDVDSLYLINSVRGLSVVRQVKGMKNYRTDDALADKMMRHWNEMMGL